MSTIWRYLLHRPPLVVSVMTCRNTSLRHHLSSGVLPLTKVQADCWVLSKDGHQWRRSHGLVGRRGRWAGKCFHLISVAKVFGDIKVWVIADGNKNKNECSQMFLSLFHRYYGKQIRCIRIYNCFSSVLRSEFWCAKVLIQRAKVTEQSLTFKCKVLLNTCAHTQTPSTEYVGIYMIGVYS